MSMAEKKPADEQQPPPPDQAATDAADQADAARERELEADRAAHQAATESTQAQAATALADRALVGLEPDAQEQAMRERVEADRIARGAEVARIEALTAARGDEPDLLWVVSNRVDDRVVLFERDPLHPGGEAFVGGSGPDHVYRTPRVRELLHAGMLLEVPEPKEGPKKPLALPAVDTGLIAAQPGQPIALGRPLDPDLFGAGDLERLGRAQARLPDEVPVPEGVVVPPEPAPERERRRR
jgi:hypothetical protein